MENEQNSRVEQDSPAGFAAGRPRPAAEPGRPTAAKLAASALLELDSNRVTGGQGGDVEILEVAKCPCDCWFCGDCCLRKGLELRRRLIPVLGTFSGLMMLTFTVDPLLFSAPEAAYRYMMKRRCIGRTIQDLFRQGLLHSRRYFCVVEWQKSTLQAHFHVLVDATFLAWDKLLASWSKHRPAWAGPVVGERPAFGTVLFSRRHFAGGPEHAARYATKYLIKMPERGFPEWVLALGKSRRVRRYSTSRGFWSEPPKLYRKTFKKRSPVRLSYGERIENCGTTSNIFRIVEKTDEASGEVRPCRQWVRHVFARPEAVLEGLGKRPDCLKREGEFVAMGHRPEPAGGPEGPV